MPPWPSGYAWPPHTCEHCTTPTTCPPLSTMPAAAAAPCGTDACPKPRRRCRSCSCHDLPEIGMPELLNTLYATTPGSSLHLDGDALRVVHPDRPGRNLVPLVRLDHIVAWNGVDLTDDLLHRCAADGRSVTWLTRNGRFLARVSGPQVGSPLLRMAQYRAHEDPARRLAIAKTFVAGKLHNYRQLLLRAARDAT